MTLTEFQTHYKDLADAFGVNNFNPKRGALLFKFVADMSASWWRHTVEQMIISNNPKFNIAEGANAERKAMNSAKRAKEESDAAENLLKNASDASLRDMKQQYGSNSILELFEKMKGRVG